MIMNFLRRRNVGDQPTNHKAGATVSTPEAPETDGEFHILGDKKLKKLDKKPKGGKRRTAWIFVMGGIFGLAIAAFFVGDNDYLDLTMFQDLKMDSIFDVLPAGMLSDARDFQVSISLMNRIYSTTANTVHTIETRERRCQLRLVRNRVASQIRRSRSSSPSHHDTRRYIYWSRKLEHRRGPTSIL
jgi:hypothetical protein